MGRKPKNQSAAQPAQQQSDITRDDLQSLLGIHANVASNIGAERGLIAQAEAKLEKKGFDAKVFRAIKTLIRGKNEAGITARKRTFDEYWEKLGLNSQGDLEEFMKSQPDTRTPHERAMDGELPEGVEAGNGSQVSEDDDAKTAKAIRKFKDNLRECAEPALVNRAMEAFMADHPDIDEEIVVEACQERFNQLANAEAE